VWDRAKFVHNPKRVNPAASRKRELTMSEERELWSDDGDSPANAALDSSFPKKRMKGRGPPGGLE